MYPFHLDITKKIEMERPNFAKGHLYATAVIDKTHSTLLLFIMAGVNAVILWRPRIRSIQVVHKTIQQ